jgi:hypothetical protein
VSGKLADSHFSAHLPEVCQRVEVAKGEADMLHEVRRELAHQRGVGVDECAPGSAAMPVWDRLGDQTLEQRGNIGLRR